MFVHTYSYIAFKNCFHFDGFSLFCILKLLRHLTTRNSLCPLLIMDEVQAEYIGGRSLFANWMTPFGMLHS